MPEILIVEQSGEITPSGFKELSVCELYKKCGYRKQDENFQEHIKWSIKYKRKTYSIRVYGKTQGKAGKENKFEFPPPFDNIIFYGKLAIVNMENEKIGDITDELWNVIYEKMFGGFENLADTQQEDDNEPDELANIDKSKITESGYLKDGFVVDDDNNTDSDVDSNGESNTESNTHSDVENDDGDDGDNEDTDGEIETSDDESDEAELKEVEYVFSDDED